MREHGKCARSHNWCACAPLWLAAQRHWVFCYLPGIELHPVFVVYGYSHRTVQTSSEPKPGAMAQVLRYRVPAEWPFCWQVRAARPAQHRTWRPLGLPQSSFGRVHPFRNQGGRSHSCQRAPTYSSTCTAAHATMYFVICQNTGDTQIDER